MWELEEVNLIGKTEFEMPQQIPKRRYSQGRQIPYLTLDSPSVNWANNPSSLNGCVWVGGWGSDEIKGVAVVST